MAGSEFANILQKIDIESQGAKNGLNGLAVFSNHVSITARMERMSEHITALYKAGLYEEARTVLESNGLWDMDI